MRYPVREALALNALKSNCRTFPVRYAKASAVIEPKLKFVQIPLQMLFGCKTT
jgi:hypothetical protein